jgi:endonuclease/exonuclease/phosphatase family metal-dependent hydrolase
VTKSIRLRVLTLNLWNMEGERSRQELLRDGIAALRPDLLALQEVTRTAAHDQLAQVLAGTGLYGIHQLDVLDADPSAERFGTALASRWQPTRIEGVDLGADATWLRRLDPSFAAVAGDGRFQCALAATIPLPVGFEVLFLAVKPAPPLDAEADRVAQACAIAELDRKLCRPAPTIIAGDFDATPDADSLRYLTGRAVVDGHSVHYHDAWAVAGDGGPGHTWTSQNPLAAPVVDWLIGQSPHARRIDYILVGSRHAHRDIAAQIRRCQVVLTEPPVSDHYGVLAEIELAQRRRTRS